MQCHECKQELKEEDFTVLISGFPQRLKNLEGRYVLVGFVCPGCGRDGVISAGISGFVPKKHFSVEEAA